MTRFLAALLLCATACGTFTFSDGQRQAFGVGTVAAESAMMLVGFELIRKDSTCADADCRNLYNTAPGGIALITLAAVMIVAMPIVLHYAREK